MRCCTRAQRAHDRQCRRVAVAVYKCKDKRETYTCGHTFIHHTVNYTNTCAHSYVHDDIPVVPVHDTHTYIHTYIHMYYFAVQD